MQMNVLPPMLTVGAGLQSTTVKENEAVFVRLAAEVTCNVQVNVLPTAPGTGSTHWSGAPGDQNGARIVKLGSVHVPLTPRSEWPLNHVRSLAHTSVGPEM